LKKIISMLLAALLIIMPTTIFTQEDCCDNFEACEQIMDECIDNLQYCTHEVDECRTLLQACEKNNKNDGDISLADLFRMIPGFNKLDKPLQVLIVSVVTLGVAYGITYLEPPGE